MDHVNDQAKIGVREAQLKGSREVTHLGLLFLAGVQGGKRFAVALQTPRAPSCPDARGMVKGAVP